MQEARTKGIADSKKYVTRLGLKAVCECVNLPQPETEKERQAGGFPEKGPMPLCFGCSRNLDGLTGIAERESELPFLPETGASG